MTDGEIMAKYGPGSTEPWTVDILCSLVRALRPKRILELGTFEGLTTAALAQAMPADAELITVEIHTARFETALAKLAYDPRIACFQADTTEFLRQYVGRPFDFVFVDDDHNALHVREELNLLHNFQGHSLMSPGGMITVHDVAGPFNLDLVVNMHHGYSLKYRRLHHAGGLGIIQIPFDDHPDRLDPPR